MITYDKFWALAKARGIRQRDLVAAGIGGKTRDRLRKGDPVTTDTIDKLCCLLDCTPGDLLEYVERKEDVT